MMKAVMMKGRQKCRVGCPLLAHMPKVASMVKTSDSCSMEQGLERCN